MRSRPRDWQKIINAEAEVCLPLDSSRWHSTPLHG
jgi:hypothetical protein